MTVVNLGNEFLCLTGDRKSDIEVSTIFESDMDFIIAELKPSRNLAPHYHKAGSEIYHVLSGNGVIELGKLSDNKIKWESSHALHPGDAIMVDAYVVHQLKNMSEEVLHLVFITPKAHLGKDRFFI